MAGILFNGTTSKLEHASAFLDVSIPFTICMWLRMDGAGGGSAGRALSISGAGPLTDGILVGCPSSLADKLQLLASWTTASGAQWTVPFSTGTWRPVSITYDPTSTANDPVFRVDYANATVTESRAPTGTYTAGVGGYCIGNNTSQARGWNGGIAHFQFFPGVTLSAAAADKANKYPSSVRINDGVNQPFWAPMLIGTYVKAFVYDFSSGAWTGTSSPTATALATYTTNSFKARRRRLLAPSRPTMAQRVA